MPTVFCTQCGQHNADNSRYCARCGAPLTRPGDPLPTERADGSSTSTSTISLSGLDAMDGDAADDEALAEAQTAEALLPGSAMLIVKRGPNAGARFLLDKDVTTAGRHPDSDIFLDDVTVSRRHAEFARNGERFVVRDVGSLNGTYLNRERIDRAGLSGGDEVQVGKFRLMFLARPSA